MKFSEERTEIASALVKAWACIEAPKHNDEASIRTKKGDVYTFTYTDLGGMLTAVRSAYKDFGLAVMQDVFTTFNDAGYQVLHVETMVLHESGQWVQSTPLTMPLLTDSNKDLNTIMKEFGSQITYLKRYSLAAMIGMASEKDADAAVTRGGSRNHGNNDNTPMPKTADEAANIVLPFGKNKGKTLATIWNEDYTYIEWIKNSDKTDQVYKVAVKLMQDSQQQPQEEVPLVTVPKNAQEAAAMPAPTQDFPGKTLGELWHENPGYIAWVAENIKSPAYVTAIQLMRLAVEQKQQQPQQA